jgi:hypothetical protein
MEAYLSAAGREEAQRWIGIAAKLLAARDLVGSKSFALRAQESDPNSQPAAQILAVVDTLFAGEKRINSQQDLYTILQVPHSTHDWEIIAANYRRLALLLNPHMNNFPFADQAFRFVLEAWSILSNPSRKSVYDNEINFQPTFNSIPEQLPSDLHQNHQNQQQGQFQEETLNENPRNGVETENVVEESEVHNVDGFSDDESLTFWTACPYCYSMYEYPRVYVECCLRCQNCKRAFQAVKVELPPQIDFDKKEPVFSCFGFFPIVVSQKNDGGAASNWCPFSQIAACPPPVKNAKNVENANAETGKKPTGRKSTGPVVYIDDDDDDDPEVLDKMSDSGDDDSSDGEWRKSSYVHKKKAKSVEKPVSSGRQGRPPKQSNVNGAKSVEKPVSSGRRGRPPKQSNVNGGIARNLRSGTRLDTPEPSKKVVSNNVKRQVGRPPKKNLGKLDLNVELSNEVEDPNGGGRREEENIEGIGFFEGLDEFLSNLPILSEDKVKEVA